MNVVMWLFVMFFLGIVAMGVCGLFVKACEKI